VELIVKPDVVVSGDPVLLQSAISNLIENAWKFTAKHPRARIEFGEMEKNGIPVYFVRDDGAGFDMASSQKLFQAFQRLHSNSEFAGNGVGLATVARIVKRHGGRVWAEGAVERGATFYFSLSPEKSGAGGHD
jgi:light-regulated signal transduction histidine kinase (bacteriophytochrome)